VRESAVETDDSYDSGIWVDWRSRLIAESKSAPSHAAQRSAAHYGFLARSSASLAAEEGRLAHLNLASRRLNDQRDARHAGFADVRLYGGGVQNATQFVGLRSLEVERLRGAEPR
jgi:hypothetical protein